jgi:hypothetical protein
MPTLRSHLCWILAIGLSLTLLACTDAAPPDSTYRYVFEEANDTPNALAATLFHALVTEDEALWMKYTATADELKTYEENNRRRRSSDERISETVATVQKNFADLRDEMRYVNGVHGADRVRFLRAYTQSYTPDDSTKLRTVVEYTFQDHYIGALLFRRTIRTDRGWVLAERSRYRDDVQRLVPLVISRR